jgi:hypothetical protein
MDSASVNVAAGTPASLEPDVTRGGQSLSHRGDRCFRVWACPDHLEGLTGLRKFGLVRPR